MLSEASLQRIGASAGWRQNRVEMLALPEGEVIVKGQRPPRGALRFQLMSGLAKCTRNPLIKPVPAPGGRQAQLTEVRRLQALAQARVPVPEVLHQGEDFIVMRRIRGEPLQHQFTVSPEAGLRAFGRGLDALQSLHRQQQYLSQAFARNILVDDQRLWFIDFEDDPLQVMDLPDAQARDLLAYLMSAIWLCRASCEDMMAAWSAASGQVDPVVLSRVKQAVEGLAWLRFLPRERKPWGRDVVTVQALAAFLHHWLTAQTALS